MLNSYIQSALECAARKTLQRLCIHNIAIPEPLEYELSIPSHMIEG